MREPREQSEAEYDLVIVGSGVSGWTAAARAHQFGLRVAITEKFDAAPGFGNGTLSGGVYHACYLGSAFSRPSTSQHR